MSELSGRIAGDIEALRLKAVEVTTPTPDRLTAKLQQAGFRPTRLGPRLTTYAPAVPPDRPNGYLAPDRPGYIVATMNRETLAPIPPGTVERHVGPDMAARIKLAADSVRTAGLPVFVILIDATPSKDSNHE